MLAGEYSYRGSRVIRTCNLEELKLKADASVKNGAGYRWITMNHSHVLIKGNGIVGGARGRLNGTVSRPRGSRNLLGAEDLPAGGVNDKGKPETERLALLENSQALGAPRAKRLGGAGQAAPGITSMDEAEAALGKAGFRCGSMESLRDLDAKLMVDNVNSLLELEHRFGIVKKLGGVELTARRLADRRAGAQTKSYPEARPSSILELNTPHYKSEARHRQTIEGRAETRLSMPCRPEHYSVYTIIHEFGHLFQNAMYLEEFRKKGVARDTRGRTNKEQMASLQRAMDNVDKRVLREMAAIAKRKDPKFRLNDHLSRHCFDEKIKLIRAEAFAEIFANSQCGAPNAAGEAMNIWLKEKGFLRQNRGDGVEARLDIILRAKDGYTAVLKDGLSYQGSRVIRSDSREALYAKAKAAQRSDWWVTMNGSHVLIKGDRIVGGAGGNLNGKKFGTQFTKGARSRWLKNRHTWAGSSLGGVENRGSEGPAPKIRNLTQIGAALTGSGFAEANGSSFKNLDKSLVIANMNRILELEQKFGVAKTLGNVKLEAVSMRSSGGYTTVACIGTEIALSDIEFQFNKQCYGRGSRRVEKTENHTKNGYFMPCAPEDYAVYTATHEYGHLLQNVLYQKELEKRGWSRKDRYALANRDASDPMWIADRYFEARMKVQSRCVREIEKIGKRKDPDFRLFDHLSDYGKTNYAEAFAEMFANSQCGAPNAAGEAMSIWLKEKGFLK